jgi:hypothetical protein
MTTLFDMKNYSKELRAALQIMFTQSDTNTERPGLVKLKEIKALIIILILITIYQCNSVIQS